MMFPIREAPTFPPKLDFWHSSVRAWTLRDNISTHLNNPYDARVAHTRQRPQRLQVGLYEHFLRAVTRQLLCVGTAHDKLPSHRIYEAHDDRRGARATATRVVAHVHVVAFDSATLQRRARQRKPVDGRRFERSRVTRRDNT